MSETVGIGPFKKGLRRRKQKLRLDESEEAEKRIASQQKIFKPHPGRQGVQQPWTPRQAILGVEMTIKKKTKQKKKQNKIKYYSEPRMGHVYARSLATSSALNNWKWAFNQRKVKLSLEYFLFAFWVQLGDELDHMLEKRGVFKNLSAVPSTVSSLKDVGSIRGGRFQRYCLLIVCVDGVMGRVLSVRLTTSSPYAIHFRFSSPGSLRPNLKTRWCRFAQVYFLFHILFCFLVYLDLPFSLPLAFYLAGPTPFSPLGVRITTWVPLVSWYRRIINEWETENRILLG